MRFIDISLLSNICQFNKNSLEWEIPTKNISRKNIFSEKIIQEKIIFKKLFDREISRTFSNSFIIIFENLRNFSSLKIHFHSGIPILVVIWKNKLNKFQPCFPQCVYEEYRIAHNEFSTRLLPWQKDLMQTFAFNSWCFWFLWFHNDSIHSQQWTMCTKYINNVH